MTIGLIQGVPTYEPIISEVQDKGPAFEAGMQDGDLVREVEGSPITSWQEFAKVVQEHPEEELSFVVERGGELIPLQITPSLMEEAGQKYGQVGVYYTSPTEDNPLKAIAYGAERTWWWMTEILSLLGQLITGKFSIDALSGPVGIYQATGEVAKYGIVNLMHWAAILSVNLGIMNLLPLPALDGGRLLFFLFEAVRGKPVDKQKKVWFIL